MAFRQIATVMAALTSRCEAIQLFAAQTNGHLTTLNLATSSNGSTTLSVLADAIYDNMVSASVINVDHNNSVVYVTDRGASTATRGTTVSYSYNSTGVLMNIDSVNVPAQGVAANFFGSGANRGLMMASYNASAITVIRVDDGGIPGGLATNTTQEIFPTIQSQGPIPLRQDRSYSHDIQVTPSGTHIFVSEMGGDVWRVFTFDAATLVVTEVAQLATEAGVGPRHAVFRTESDGSLSFFFVGELSQEVYWYTVDIGDDGVSWTKLFSLPALGDDDVQPVNTAPPSEIAISPDNAYLLVSNRDVSQETSAKFQSSSSDTLSTFAINKANNTLSLIQLAPSGGYSPRQLQINKAGTMVAVGHQGNRSVLIWERDVGTGRIGGLIGKVALSGRVVSTVWDE